MDRLSPSFCGPIRSRWAVQCRGQVSSCLGLQEFLGSGHGTFRAGSLEGRYMLAKSLLIPTR